MLALRLGLEGLGTVWEHLLVWGSFICVEDGIFGTVIAVAN